MARPTTKEEFKAYCLRRLGDGAIEINVTDAQVDDRVNDSVNYWWDYHYDGAMPTYLKHAVTQTDIDNSYITVPDSFIGIVELLPFGDVGSMEWHSGQYQVLINELQNVTDFSTVNYFFAQQRIEELQTLLSNNPPFRFNRILNQLFLDFDWATNLKVGDYLILRAYQIIPDDDTVADMWKDLWLGKYATQMIKQQWGSNLSKFEGLMLPGGVTFNGQQIYDQATEEINRLEDEMLTNYSVPLIGFMA